MMTSPSNPPRRRTSHRIPPLSRARSAAFALVLGLISIDLSGCITKRTVTRDGVVVDQEMIVKRPFKDVKVE